MSPRGSVSQACARLGDRAAAAEPYEVVSRYPEGNVVILFIASADAIARSLGQLATLLEGSSL